MGTINQQSVRNEFDKIKQDFDQLLKEGKVSPECKALMSSFFTLFELVLSVLLERFTKKSSKNSSKPPSQTSKDKSALGRSGGKGKKERAQLASNTRTVETTEIVSVTCCDQCGTSLEGVDCQCYERRTKIDIIFEKVVQHVDAEVKNCPACKKKVKAQHPEDMPGPSPVWRWYSILRHSFNG